MNPSDSRHHHNTQQPQPRSPAQHPFSGLAQKGDRISQDRLEGRGHPVTMRACADRPVSRDTLAGISHRIHPCPAVQGACSRAGQRENTGARTPPHPGVRKRCASRLSVEVDAGVEAALLLPAGQAAEPVLACAALRSRFRSRKIR